MYVTCSRWVFSAAVVAVCLWVHKVEAAPGPRDGVVYAVFEDKGIFGEHLAKVQIVIPAFVDREHSSIVVNKQKRLLVLRFKGVPVKVYPIALGFTPEGDKVQQGDGKTPEGEYYICEMLHKDLAPKYGARSMRISYPNAKDAARGRKQGLISESERAAIGAAIKRKQTPSQGTKLGSSIRIHGGGIGQDWTAGCVALRDSDVIELYRLVASGTPVTITARSTTNDRDHDGIPDQVDILIGAKKLAHNKASYQGGYTKLSYPGGDVASDIGVCTDVIVRAMRNAGYDLQKILHEAIGAHPKRFPMVKTADTHIDQRRVKTLLPLFELKYKLVNKVRKPKGKLVYAIGDENKDTLMPGDIVFMDTLSMDGRPDHIGIVSDTQDAEGYPHIINNWTDGYHTQVMDLLPDWPITHHFRIVPR